MTCDLYSNIRGIFMQNEEIANIISDTSSQQVFENWMSSSDKKVINLLGKFITDSFILRDGSMVYSCSVLYTSCIKPTCIQ